jgi:hypothetical protein
MTTTGFYDTASGLTGRRFPLLRILVSGLAALNVASAVLTLLG